MAGHSKWANIKHRKERMDNKRGKIFSRLVKEIFVAAKLNGEDPGANPRLRLALQKAKEANLPKDNIDKAIRRGVGKLDGATYEEVRHEGYGPEGIAVIVDCLTDNRNRTTAEVRHAFTKYGGSLGTDGSVSYLFEWVGQLLYAPNLDTDILINKAIEAGARDFAVEEDDSVEIITDAATFHNVLQFMESNDVPPNAAELIMRSLTTQPLVNSASDKVRKLLEVLEDCDDTQHIYSNAQFIS